MGHNIHQLSISWPSACLFQTIFFLCFPFCANFQFLNACNRLSCLQKEPPVLLRTPHPPTHILLLLLLPPHTFSNLLDNLWDRVPCEQRFLFCMVFTIYKVIRVACLSRSWFVLVNKLTTQQTSHVNYFVNAKSHAREKPLLAE